MREPPRGGVRGLCDSAGTTDRRGPARFITRPSAGGAAETDVIAENKHPRASPRRLDRGQHGPRAPVGWRAAEQDDAELLFA
jgi:hypothetical protein